MTESQLATLVRAHSVDVTHRIEKNCMFAPTINLNNSCFICNLNFLWFKLILKCAQSESTVRSFTPTINFSSTATYKEALIATTSYLVNIATLSRYTFNKNW